MVPVDVMIEQKKTVKNNNQLMISFGALMDGYVN